jgi:putative FmdB family regulatory protein
MPIYEYRCEKCGVFEETQRITDPPLDRCPTCRRKVRRLISNTSFQLKGGGWYVTDYARAGKGEGKDTGKDSAKETGGTSESTGTSESKTKTESKSSKSDAKAAGAGA